MKKIVLILIGLTIFNQVFSQLVVKPLGGQPPLFVFNFQPLEDIPATYPVNPDFSAPSNSKLIDESRYRQYIEFGDGYFSNDFYGENIQAQLGNNGAYNPFILSYRIYAPWPPKATDLEENVQENLKATDVSKRISKTQNRIPTNKRITIEPSINNIVPSDVMVFAIPFKRREQSPDVNIVFFYNEINKSIFIPLVDAKEQCTWNKTSINAIRLPIIQSTIISKRQPARSSTSVQIDSKDARSFGNQPVLQNLSTKYLNSVTISITNIADTLEHNVFITLRTKTEKEIEALNSVAEKSYINTDAMVIAGDTDVADTNSTANLQLPFLYKSHDPNQAYASPTCFKKDTKENITFRIYFSNDGRGDAQQILVDAMLKSNGAFNYNTIKIKKLVLGKQEYTSGFVQGGGLNWAKFTPGTFAISIPTKSTGAPVSFTLAVPQTTLLKGIPIQYKLDTYTGNDNLGYVEFTSEVEAPNNEDSIAFSGKIKFNSENFMETPNSVVISVKEDCKSVAVPCTSIWCIIKWWMWLLLAILLIVIWVIFRKK